jgi:hypothetical protein
MKYKKAVVTLVLMAVMAVGAAFAEEPDIDIEVSHNDLFNLFLLRLVQRHEELGGLVMPDVEALTGPDFDVLYCVYFETPEDAEIFCDVLIEEDIPCITFPDDDKEIWLFQTDLLYFIVMSVIGL